MRELLDVRDIAAFERFLMLCAARHGQVLNMAHLSRDSGVSQPTIKHWLSVLEASYLIHRLPAWSGNLGKRLTRSPKLYFIDPALVAYLTCHPAPELLLPGPMGAGLPVQQQTLGHSSSAKPQARWTASPRGEPWATG